MTENKYFPWKFSIGSSTEKGLIIFLLEDDTFPSIILSRPNESYALRKQEVLTKALPRFQNM